MVNAEISQPPLAPIRDSPWVELDDMEYPPCPYEICTDYHCADRCKITGRRRT